MTLKKITLFFLLSMLTIDAFAETWYPVAIGNNIMIFIDKSSIEKKGKLKKFWQWQFFANPLGKVDSVKTYVAIDCSEKTRRTEYLIGISNDDNIIQEGVPESDFSKISKDSLESQVLIAVCENKFAGKPQPQLKLQEVRKFINGIK